MATTTHNRVTDVPVLAWTSAIAVIWLIAAFLRSDTTLHLGPLLLPLVPAVLGRETGHPIRLTIIGILAGMATIIVLSTTGNLDGPALDPFPDALTESIIFLAGGGVLGLVVSASAGRRTAKAGRRSR